MVVIATPDNHPIVTPCCDPQQLPGNLNAVPCAGQNVLSATVSADRGLPILTRMRAVTLTQGQCGVVAWQMHDKDGHPVDLTPCGLTESEAPAQQLKVVLRMKEQLSLGNARPPLQVDASVVDASEGRVEADIESGMTDYPGIYYGEMCLVSTELEANGKPCVVFSNTFYVVVARSTFGDGTGGMNGPPSIAEIRLHLRDSAPGESYLLDHLMFDDAEIALAIARPVMYWNETPPPLNQNYTTQNFPFRYHWLEGICANLFFMVAEQYRRNDFQYSAAGMSINDQNKSQAYEQAGQTRWQAFREWVRATKASINLESCYGEVTSTYKYSAYSSGLRIRY
jgi:hypothetical protein